MPKAPSIYSVAVPGSESPDCTPIYRHPDFVKKLCVDMEDPSHKTVWDVITSAVKKWPNINCQGTRVVDSNGKAQGFAWKSYAEVFERVSHVASGIKEHMKMDVTNQMKLLGLMGMNSPEWTCAEWACMGLGGTTIPLYTTTPKETLEYILNQNGCAVVVADTLCAASLLKAKPDMTIEQAGSLITPRNLNNVWLAVLTAWHDSVKAEDDGEETTPGEAVAQVPAA